MLLRLTIHTVLRHCAVLVGLFVHALSAQALHIYIAFDAKGDPKNASLLDRVERHIKDSFPEATTSVITSLPALAPPTHTDDGDQIIVSLGNESLQWLSQSSFNLSTIAIFINRSSFTEYSQRYFSDGSDGQITAIFSDPSIFRQLALIRALYGNNTIVGYFVRDNTGDIDTIVDYSRQIGLSIKQLRYQNPTVAADLVNDIDVLLLQNNRRLFSRISLDDLLYITYDLNNTGIVGYSSGLVKSGAVATTYHGLDDILGALQKSLRHFVKTGSLPTPSYPETYRLLSNKYVIRSLGISDPQDDKIIDFIDRHDQRKESGR